MNTPTPTPRTDATWSATIAQLNAEVERLRSDRDCEKRFRKDAEEFREDAIARAERAEAILGKLQELHGCSQEMVVHWSEHAAKRALELDFQVARNSDLFKERDDAVEAQGKAEAELAVERARLDWLQNVDPDSRQWSIICDYTDIRAVIDAAMKEGATS